MPRVYIPPLFDDVNSEIGRFRKRGIEPTILELCEALGVDPDDRRDYQSVYSSIYATRMIIFDDWATYEKLPLFDRDVTNVSDDDMRRYGNESNGFVAAMRTGEFETLDAVRANMIVACLWDRFLDRKERENLYFVVPRGKGGGRRYYRPNYWRLIQYDIRSFRRVMLSAVSLVRRHISLRGILPSGLPLREALESTEHVLSMLTDGMPEMYECPICSIKESKPEYPWKFASKDDLRLHLEYIHGAK